MYWLQSQFSILNSRAAQWCGSGMVSIGSSIYHIGGYIDSLPTSTVAVLDCRSHTWREAPNMCVKRSSYVMTNVFDGNIYVIGGNGEDDRQNWMEVFDLERQTWEIVMHPFEQGYRCGIMRKSAVIDDTTMCIFGDKGVAYNPRQGLWEEIGEINYLDLGWNWLCYCVIGKVLYSYTENDGIKWYDSKEGCWKPLKDLKGVLPKFAGYAVVKIADYGGKLVVLRDKYLPSSGGCKSKTIWCAVIALEGRGNADSREMWGKVEWLDLVLTVPESCKFVCALSATV